MKSTHPLGQLKVKYGADKVRDYYKKNKAVDEGVTATHKGTEYKLLPGKARKDLKKHGKGGLDGDYRTEAGKIKDAVTDKLGLTNTKRDGVKCPKGHQDCGEEFVPRNSMGKPIRIKDKIRAAKGQIPHTEAVDPKAKGFDPKAEDDDQPAEPPKQDPKEKRVGMMKRMILQKKMQAVRSGAGMDIVAHTELEGEVISEKKAKKDYDGDGEIESDTDEYKGSKDKAIKKSMKKEKANEAYTVTNADKKGNTPAWQGYKSGKKNSKTGKALYTAAGHVKEGYNRLGLKSWTSFVEDNDIDRPIEDQTDKQIADVTFDGGAALPATIKGCGDAREIPTAVALIKNKYRAQGIMASKEPEGDVLTEEFINESVDFATEYFYKEGLNEEGLDLVIEDVGIDEFTEFVLGLQEDLNEERSAERAKPRDYAKVKASVDKTDAKHKAAGTREYSKSAAAKRNYGDKPAPEGKPEKKVVVKKKVEKSVAKAKKVQPAKPISKPGLGDKIRSTIKKGVERHNKARAAGRVPEKRAKEFGKGVVSGVKTAVKTAGAVKKAVVGEGKLEAE